METPPVPRFAGDPGAPAINTELVIDAARVLKRPERRESADKYLLVICPGPSIQNIVTQCFSNICGKRERNCFACFFLDKADLSFWPENFGEFEACDVNGTHSKDIPQKDDGVVTFPGSRLPIDYIQNGIYHPIFRRREHPTFTANLKSKKSLVGILRIAFLIQKAVELSQIKVDIIDGGGSHFLHAAMEIFLNDLLIRLSNLRNPLSLEPVEVPPCNPFHIAHGVWVKITTGKESLHNLRIISVQFVPGTPFGNIPEISAGPFKMGDPPCRCCEHGVPFALDFPVPVFLCYPADVFLNNLRGIVLQTPVTEKSDDRVINLPITPVGAVGLLAEPHRFGQHLVDQ